MKNLAILSVSLFLFLNPILGQDFPFSRGVNLTSWFQAGSAREVQFRKFDKTDLEQIRSLGFDHIRLPINLHSMTDGEPSYTLDPLFLNFLDQVVDWTEELGLYLILDNHTFDVDENTDPNIDVILEKVWSQMAQHYKDRSDKLFYEVLNEPHGISDVLWNNIQIGVVNAIRAVDPVHTIVVGAANWNSYQNLAFMPNYEDQNLLYTFHFYDPFLFTHQGASWVSPSMEALSEVPFPYDASRMPPLPSSLFGTWVGTNYAFYQQDGTVEKVYERLDIAVDFRDARNVPIYCGELGVFIPNSPSEDRLFWYKTVVTYLEANDIPWTMWDYQGGFGLYKEGGNDLFEHDLNTELLEALALNVPEQSPFELNPSQEGFFIFDDYVGRHITSSNFNNGSINLYSPTQPNNGQYCLSWTGAKQYNHIGFDFKPNLDLSELAGSAYALDLFVRGDQPGQALDIRFMDTKTSPTDRPWRMRVTLDERIVAWDGRWHHVHVPLSNFTEHGAWDGAWFPPEGKFDWQAIDRLEIVTEYGDMGNATFWFDNIHITDLDTAQINDPFTVSLETELSRSIRIYPNPISDILYFEVPQDQSLSYQLFDALGGKRIEGRLSAKKSVDIRELPSGFYFVKILDQAQVLHIEKLVKH